MTAVGWSGLGLLAVVCVLCVVLWLLYGEMAGLLMAPLVVGFWLAVILIVVGLPQRPRS